jgi:DNA mismatch endonuclease, patch repair protein
LVEQRKPLTRSKIMARIQFGNMKPEMVLRRGLDALGFMLMASPENLISPGRKIRTAISLFRCSWSGQACRENFRITKSSPELWMTKISTNRNWDNRAVTAIRGVDWRALLVWEYATRSICLDNIVQIAAAWLQGAKRSAELAENGPAFPREFTPRIVGK